MNFGNACNCEGTKLLQMFKKLTESRKSTVLLVKSNKQWERAV